MENYNSISENNANLIREDLDRELKLLVLDANAIAYRRRKEKNSFISKFHKYWDLFTLKRR